MPEFSRDRNGAVRVRFEPDESLLLSQLTTELGALVSGPEGSDPVLDRLFPAAYEDPDDEKAYRELISGDLSDEKLRAFELVRTAVEGAGRKGVFISPDDAAPWLACLTDLRLAIGTRLRVDEERMGAELNSDDPDAGSMAVLHWLGWVQESIIQTIEDSPTPTDA